MARTARFLLNDVWPLHDSKNPEWPWFHVVKIDGEMYRLANPQNLEELKKWAKEMEGDDVEIIVKYG